MTFLEKLLSWVVIVGGAILGGFVYFLKGRNSKLEVKIEGAKLDAEIQNIKIEVDKASPDDAAKLGNDLVKKLGSNSGDKAK